MKIDNEGLKDQLGWAEFNYSIINKAFLKLVKILKLIFVIEFFAFPLTKCQINDEFIYKFYLKLFDFGFKPKYYKYLKNYGYLHKYISNLIIYSNLVIGIFLLFFIVKRAFYGGFRNQILVLINFILSIIFSILNLVLLIYTLFIFIYAIFAIICSLKIIIFHDDDIIYIKLILSTIIYFILFILITINFFYNVKFSFFLRNIQIENSVLGTQTSRFGEIFKYNKKENNSNMNTIIGDNLGLPKNHCLILDNSIGVPKKLLYFERELIKDFKINNIDKDL